MALHLPPHSKFGRNRRETILKGVLTRRTFILAAVLAPSFSGCAIPSPRQTPESKRTAVNSAATDYQQTVETITRIVGKHLELEARELDVDAPLSKQRKPADDLDVVEIMMRVEEAFNVEIKDEDIGESVEGISRTLSIKKLADIVSKKRAHK